MTVPTTYLAALLLALLTMICWGSWANTTKMTGKWRFEMFYLDFSIGVLLAVSLLALTLGEMGEELSFRDNLLITGKRQLAFGGAAGVVFNLANMFLVAAISLAGMAIAFPVGVGTAVATGVIWSYLSKPTGSPLFLFGGAAVLVGAIVVTVRAHQQIVKERNAERAKTWTSKHRPPPKIGLKAVWLSLVCGLLMGTVPLLIAQSRSTDLGLRPYAVAFTFGLGLFLSTPFYTLFFINVPVQGKPIGIRPYLSGTVRQHLLGVAGGVLLAIGVVAMQTVVGAPEAPLIPNALASAIFYAAILLATLWGLLYWKEFQIGPAGTGRLGALMVVLLVAGLGLISLAAR
jgi:glucose uptake protein